MNPNLFPGLDPDALATGLRRALTLCALASPFVWAALVALSR